MPNQIKPGGAHIKVRDLARAEAFYTTILGLQVTERVGQLLLLSSGGRHHELVLEEVGVGGSNPDERQVGLTRVAWEVPDAWEFWRKHQGLTSVGLRFEALDLGVMWTLRFQDPDGNGVEIVLDTRTLPSGRGDWRGVTEPLDPEKVWEVIRANAPGVEEF